MIELELLDEVMMPSDNNPDEPILNEKGIAVIAAIESGLLPETKEGWDDTTFNAFWEKFIAYRGYR